MVLRDQHMPSFFQLIQGHATGAVLVDDWKDMAPLLDRVCDFWELRIPFDCKKNKVPLRDGK